MNGSVFKRCPCPTNKRRNKACKKDHGSWYYVHDLPNRPGTKRRRVMRGGHLTKGLAEQPVDIRMRAAEKEGRGVDQDSARLLTSVADAGLHRAVERQIARGIVRGDFVPGTPLPSEAVLIGRFGVSRAVVRAALRSLAQRGMVDMRQGRRTAVLPQDAWDILDPLVLEVHRDEGRIRPLVRDALQVRCWLEPEAAAEAARRTDSRLAQDLSQLLERMQESLGDVDTFLAADVEFHERIARVRPVTVHCCGSSRQCEPCPHRA